MTAAATNPPTTTPPTVSNPSAQPARLGVHAQVLRPARAEPSPRGGISSHVDELTITATVNETGSLTPIGHHAHTGRVRDDAPEAWLYLRTLFGRPTWAIIPAIPAGHPREPDDVARYLNGWMASGNFAAIRNGEAVVGWYGAVAIHDRREWPPYLARHR